MLLKNYIYQDGWSEPLDTLMDSKNTLVLLFGSSKRDLVLKPLKELKELFSNSIIIGSSTAGEIYMDELKENSLVVAVIKFQSTKLKLVTKFLNSPKDSFSVGANIATSLKRDKLKSIFILSDGLNLNGSQLTHGINSVKSDNVIVSGGLAGDDARFESTWIVVDGQTKSRYISAVGFYGDTIKIGYGFKGGWDKFGIQRRVTKSVDNILYELDDKPALDIYKTYLGDKAKDLPASGLLFPLELQEDDSNKVRTVRTILAVNEDQKSITFAGDIPQGSTVSLMKANHDRLIDGAYNASKKIDLSGYNDEDILCIAISCVGRKLVLKQRTEDELEMTLENLPVNTKQIGFYSYGEISPISSGQCDLHNQTMTLTVIWEDNAPST
jgi:hypothetical protein